MLPLLGVFFGFVPVNFTDPTGLILDTVLDVGFVIYDIYVLVDHLVEGCGNIEEDLLALGLDLGGVLIPFATGGGVAVRAASKVDDIGNVTQLLNKLDDTGDSVKILVVGESSFDFSRALHDKLGSFADILATSYDSLKSLLTKGFSPPPGEKGFSVLHGIDARKLGEHFGNNKFDLIFFNNPHAGSGGATASLIEDFIKSAQGQLNPGGEIHINVTQQLLKNHKEVVETLSKFALDQVRKFGDSPYFVPFTPSLTTGQPMLYYGKNPNRARDLLNYVFRKG